VKVDDFVTSNLTDLHKMEGATENAGVENAIRTKMQGWKMQEYSLMESLTYRQP